MTMIKAVSLSTDEPYSFLGKEYQNATYVLQMGIKI